MALFVFLVLAQAAWRARALRFMGNIDVLDSYRFVATWAGMANSRAPKVGQAVSYSALQAMDLGNSGGLVSYSITIPSSSRTSLLLFDDYKAWKKASADTKMPCWKLMGGAREVISLWSHSPVAKGAGDLTFLNYVNKSSSVDGSITANGVITFQNAAWCIMMLANCEQDARCPLEFACQGPLSANVKLSMVNGNLYNAQVSMENRGLVWCTIAFFVLQFWLTAGGILTRRDLMKIGKFHPVLRLLLLAIITHFVGLLCTLFYWLFMIARTTSSYNLLAAGIYLTAISNYFIIILLILLGKGLSIVRQSISSTGVLKVVAFATGLLVCIIFAEAFAVWGSDTSSGMYMYSSSSGILLLCIRCIFAFSWFIFTGITQMKTFEVKKRFYRKFLAFFGFWLVAPFPLVLITVFGLEPINQTVFVFIWEQILTFAAQFALLLMFSPRLAKINSKFPFHAYSNVGVDFLLYANTPSSKAAGGRLGSFEGAVQQKNPSGSEGPEVKTIQVHKTVTDLYTDIKDSALGLSETIRSLARMENNFRDALSEWLNEMDEDEEEE